MSLAASPTGTGVPDLVIEGVELLTPGTEPMRSPTSISVVGDRIVAIGPSPISATRVIDGRGRLAIPGLVNAHAHAAFTLSRGWEPAASLDEWLPWVFAVGENIGPKDAAAGARLAFVEMVMSGITTVVDHHYATADRRNTAAVAEAAAEVGLRVALATTAPDVGAGASTIADVEADLAMIAEVGQRPGARLSPWIGLASPGRRESPERSRALADLARRAGVRLTYHYAETPAWRRLASDLGYRRPVDVLSALDLLGPDVLIAHGVWFTEDELDVVAASGATIVHCPVSNMYLGDGAAPVIEMLARDIRVALGTDGANCNNRLDMFASMKSMALLQRLRRLDGAAMSPEEAFRAATATGADALGLGLGGRLEVGSPADVVLLDVSGPAFQPGHDRMSDVVHVAAAGDVRTVVIAGEVVVEEGMLRRGNLEGICRDGAAAGRRVIAATRRPISAGSGRGHRSKSIPPTLSSGSTRANENEETT